MVAIRCVMGGSGFYVLTWNGERLAYMQRLDREGGAAFYELRHDILWRRILTGEEDVLKVLQRGIKKKKLGLYHILKNPTGQMRRRDYDLSKVIIEEILGCEWITIEGRLAPKKIRFTHPQQGVPTEIPRKLGYVEKLVMRERKKRQENG